jgi:hypothetical protein
MLSRRARKFPRRKKFSVEEEDEVTAVTAGRINFV